MILLIKGLLMFIFALIVIVVGIALVCVGPVAAWIGYNAIYARLWREDPHNPLLQNSFGFWTPAEQRRIVWAYTVAHGVDADVVLAVGGLLMSIPGLYVGIRLMFFVGRLFPGVPL